MHFCASLVLQRRERWILESEYGICWLCLAALHQSEVSALWTLWRKGKLCSHLQTTWGLHRQTDGWSLPKALHRNPRVTERSRRARWVPGAGNANIPPLDGLWNEPWALLPHLPVLDSSPLPSCLQGYQGLWHFGPSILAGRENCSGM